LYAFGDILLATSRRLRHLVNGPIAIRRQETTAEDDRPLINDIAFLVNDKMPETTMRKNDITHANNSHEKSTKIP
jgi:hypothetical protein